MKGPKGTGLGDDQPDVPAEEDSGMKFLASVVRTGAEGGALGLGPWEGTGPAGKLESPMGGALGQIWVVGQAALGLARWRSW